jgi:hypothetical protein
MRFFRFAAQDEPSPSPNVGHFLSAMATVASPIGPESFAFKGADGARHGVVQFTIRSHGQLAVHRIWTDQPGRRDGSAMLKKICRLADEHGVEITLKVLPFGRKPYPLSVEQLIKWYQRYGFEGTAKKMVRKPTNGPASSH